MIFKQLYKNLFQNKHNLNYVTELLADHAQRYQEPLFILFTVLNLNERIHIANDDWQLALDGFNMGEIKKISIDDLGAKNIKSGGSAVDCVFLRRHENHPWEMICITAKNYNHSTGIKALETADICLNLEKFYQDYKNKMIGCVCRDRDLISTPQKTSDVYAETIDPNLYFDNNDLIRWWKEKFCQRDMSKEFSTIASHKRIPFELRLHQEYTVTKTQALIKFSPGESILWGHIPRSGKSFMIAALIQQTAPEQNKRIMFAIITSIPNETKPQYQDIFRTYQGFANIHIINVSGAECPRLPEVGKVVLLFSRQFLYEKRDNKKLHWLWKLKFKSFFIDEAHYAGTTINADDDFNYFFKGIFINKSTPIYITASFNKPAKKVAKDRIILWQLEDVHLAKRISNPEKRRKLIQKHDKDGKNFFAECVKNQYIFFKQKDGSGWTAIEHVYQKFPELELLTWRLESDYKEKYLQSINEETDSKLGWSLDALFNSSKKITNTFENPDKIVDVFERIFGTVGGGNAKRLKLLVYPTLLWDCKEILFWQKT